MYLVARSSFVSASNTAAIGRNKSLNLFADTFVSASNTAAIGRNKSLDLFAKTKEDYSEGRGGGRC